MTTQTQKTRYELFVEEWKDCTQCPLHEKRNRAVLARGTGLPSPLVFVGEAPGESEDVLGLPFIGISGKLLDRIIAEAVPTDIDYTLTNVVCCIPYTRDPEKGTVKLSEPPEESVKACRPRLLEYLTIAQPKLIVAVGKVAERHLDEKKIAKALGREVPVVGVMHPAAILRGKTVNQSLLVRKAVLTIQDAIETYLP